MDESVKKAIISAMARGSTSAHEWQMALPKEDKYASGFKMDCTGRCTDPEAIVKAAYSTNGQERFGTKQTNAQCEIVGLLFEANGSQMSFTSLGVMLGRLQRKGQDLLRCGQVVMMLAQGLQGGLLGFSARYESQCSKKGHHHQKR
jgi:hypothetical protein